MNLSELTTEMADPRFAGIDAMSVGELAATMNAADSSVPGAVASALPSITEAIEAAAARMEAGGRLVYVGAGTPGRLGVLDASECPPTFSTPPEQVGIASSGRTPYVLAAVRRARSLGALTVGLSCNAGTPLSEVADKPIEVLVAPEVISGANGFNVKQAVVASRFDLSPQDAADRLARAGGQLRAALGESA
ncbi:hypothetical protein [Nonomuraea insulae]|uniref:SIS domain-containing protein n=1 Tax=Nonomuraea insulae TaxID=1616787 RepID=A0ABW1CFQ9_9ACTN